MAAQVTMLAPPSEPASTSRPKKVVAWAPVHSLDSVRQSERSLSPSHPRNPKLGTNSRANLNRLPPARVAAFDTSAHSLQFVASPGQTDKLQSILPAAIRKACSPAPTFAGYMVMISDQEARRITLVTFWKGAGHRQHCGGNAEQLKAVLLPYVDHWLRAENHVAQFSRKADLEASALADVGVTECDPTVNA